MIMSPIQCMIWARKTEKETYIINDLIDLIWFMVFNASFNNISVISWRPVLVVEEAGVPG
jgi:hypothetical protein